MEKLNIKQFMAFQPFPEHPHPVDNQYLEIANRLLQEWENSALMPHVPDELRSVVCLGLMGYYQDVVSDAGLWRTFINAHHSRYGYYVPFHYDETDYILYELNLADVEFMVWYLLAFNSMQFRYMSPTLPGLKQIASRLYHILEDEYDQVSEPVDYKEIFDCDMHDPEDAEKLYDLGQWLFWRSWLLLPPFQLTYSQIYSQIVEVSRSSKDQKEANEAVDQIRQQAMTQLPTGPMALYLREWMYLLLTGKMPSDKTTKESDANMPKEDHPYYTKFIEANKGRVIKYIKTYGELNDFFINGMGWEADQEHLPAMKGHSDFVLMATPHEGLMVAKGIAKCIKDPDNPLYDMEHARKFAFTLLSNRAVCPADMLLYICKNGWLSDARFPETPSLEQAPSSDDDEQQALIIQREWDFLARVYLQEYYRADL